MLAPAFPSKGSPSTDSAQAPLRRGLLLYNRGVFVYNPNRAPVLCGKFTIPAMGYIKVLKEEADFLRSADPSLQIEGDPGFPSLWTRYGG